MTPPIFCRNACVFDRQLRRPLTLIALRHFGVAALASALTRTELLRRQPSSDACAAAPA